MTKPVRALLSVVVIFGATGALLFTTMRESAAYYKTVDEVMDQPEAWYGKSMNLHGFVVENSIMKRPDTLDYRFNVRNGDKVVPASYTGIVPDTFKDGAEVVLTGTLNSGGFHATEVMAKCPSKYDPQTSKGGQ